MDSDGVDADRAAGGEAEAGQREQSPSEEPQVFAVQRDLKSWRLSGLNARAGRRAFLGGSLAAGAASLVPRREVAEASEAEEANGGPAIRRVARLALSIVALQATAPAHRSRVTSLAFSPDSSMLLSGSNDQTAKIWSLTDFQLQQTLGGHPFAVRAAAITPDGQAAATAAARVVKLWSFPSGQPLADLTGHTNTITNLLALPDSQTITSSAADQTLRLWSIANQAQVASIPGGGPGAHYLASRPDGSTIVGVDGGTLYSWSVSGAQQLAKVFLNGLGPVALTADGQHVVYGRGDAIYVASVPDFAVISTSPPQGDTVRAIMVSPDGAYVASAAGNAITVWSWPDFQPIMTTRVQAAVTALAIPNHSKMLASVETNIVRFWSLPDLAPLASAESRLAEVTVARFSADGRWLAGGHVDGQISLWDLQGGAARRSLSDEAIPAAGAPAVPTATPIPLATATPVATPTPPGEPGRTQPGQRGGDVTGPGGETRTVPCGSPLPPGWTCTCNCVTVPVPQPPRTTTTHYWYPN